MAKKEEKEVKIDYIPEKYQADTHENIKHHFKGTTHCIKAMRQIGKSVFLNMCLLKNASEKEKTNNYCVSPTFNQASKLYKEIKEAIAGTPILKKANETKLQITLFNGSVIRYFSAEMGDNLRGYTCDFLCIDEAAYISDNVFYSCIAAWTNVKSAPVILCSTPRFKTGFFYKYWVLGNTSIHNGTRKHFSYDWATYDTSRFLTDEKKEEYRLQLPRQTYLSEVLGQWLDMEGSVFGSFDDCIVQAAPKYNKKTDSLYMGIDWGTGQGGDNTAIAIFNQDKEMMGIWHFNDKNETQTVDFICKLIYEWEPVKVQVETNSIGSIFMGLLRTELNNRKLETVLIGFNTSNESKNKLVNKLQVALQNKSVKLLNDSVLVNELSTYESAPSKTGKMTYNARVGFHDDTIIATMLALDCISSGQPSVFFI